MLKVYKYTSRMWANGDSITWLDWHLVSLIRHLLGLQLGDDWGVKILKFDNQQTQKSKQVKMLDTLHITARELSYWSLCLLNSLSCLEGSSVYFYAPTFILYMTFNWLKIYRVVSSSSRPNKHILQLFCVCSQWWWSWEYQPIRWKVGDYWPIQS